ncbi:MAG: 2,5-diketo-D-gluconate reductase [Mycobacterium sp.]|nr:2,5-diketo-D-gluconate reductase [Mycobacterium sp.]
MSNVPAMVLNGGAHIPQLGFGVFQIEPDKTAAAVKAALDIGYRHIDTAEMYGNEQGVGQGVVEAGLDRASVFITSKLNNGLHRPDDARRALDRTLSALSSDYVDLFLIHWPLPTLYDGDLSRPGVFSKSSPQTDAPAASAYRTSNRHTLTDSQRNPSRYPL